MRIIRLVFAFVACLFAFPAVVSTGFGLLGLAGLLADVSPAENRQFGWQFLGYASPLWLGALTCLGISLGVSRAITHRERGRAGRD